MPLAQGVKYPTQVKNTLSWLRANPALAAVVALLAILAIAILSGLISEWMAPDPADYFECMRYKNAFDCRQYLP